MLYEFKSLGNKYWAVSDRGLTYDNTNYDFKVIEVISLQDTKTALVNGTIRIVAGGRKINLSFSYAERSQAHQAYDILKLKCEIDSIKSNAVDGAVYFVNGVRGKTLTVYDNRCVINVKVGIGSFITGNVTDGEKTIYYCDCIGVQFKKAGVTIGNLQLETASSQMNNKHSNFFGENTFNFDVTTVSNEKMEEVADYIKEKIMELKMGNVQNINTVETAKIDVMSSADEIIKFKQLFDAGVITQEEFEAKKKQLLGL